MECGIENFGGMVGYIPQRVKNEHFSDEHSINGIFQKPIPHIHQAQAREYIWAIVLVNKAGAEKFSPDMLHSLRNILLRQ